MPRPRDGDIFLVVDRQLRRSNGISESRRRPSQPVERHRRQRDDLQLPLLLEPIPLPPPRPPQPKPEEQPKP